MKKITLLLLALVMCFSLCACGGESAGTNADADTEKTDNISLATIVDNEGNTVEISAKELLDLEKENEAKFEKYYLGADITFIGTVKSITTNYITSGSSTKLDAIVFEEGWKVELAQGQYEDILVELSAGDKVQVESQIWSTWDNVIIRGCYHLGDSVLSGSEDLQSTTIFVVE